MPDVMCIRGLKEFPKGGSPAANAELTKMNKCNCFRKIVVKTLKRQERVRSQEGLTILLQKRSGKSKGALPIMEKRRVTGYPRSISHC